MFARVWLWTNRDTKACGYQVTPPTLTQKRNPQYKWKAVSAVDAFVDVDQRFNALVKELSDLHVQHKALRDVHNALLKKVKP